MFGIFYEDINYAADGGLYAELVRNRSFEFNTSDNGSFNGLTAWQPLDRSGAGTTAPSSTTPPGSTPQPQLPPLTAAARRRRHAQRRLQQRLRREAGRDLRRLRVGAQHHRPGAHRPARERRRHRTSPPAPSPSTARDTWKKYTLTLTATATTDAARLAVLAGAASPAARHGLADADRHLGRPGQRKSVLRKDLAEKIAALDPGFLRFPGGCVTNVGTFRTYRRPATPTAAAPTSGRRPSARSRSARPTGTSGATTSPTASATWSTSSSPRTSAPSRCRSSRSAPTAAAARIPEMTDDARDRPLGRRHRRPHRVRQRRHRHRVGRQARRARPPRAVRPAA